MRSSRLALGLLALLPLLCAGPSALSQGPIVGPGQPILCANNGANPTFGAPAQATIATATTTSLIAGVAGKITVMCGWHVTSSQTTSTTFQFEYGTQGGPCTTPTVLTPAFSVTSNAPSSDHIDYGSIQAPAGAQVCVVTTGATVAQSVVMYYSQF